jgi:hypothetical protein
VKTENPSAYVKVNWKVCRIAIAPVLSVVPNCVNKVVNKSSHPVQTPSIVTPPRGSILAKFFL